MSSATEITWNIFSRDILNSIERFIVTVIVIIIIIIIIIIRFVPVHNTEAFSGVEG